MVVFVLRRFERFIYEVVRKRDFRDMKNDETVRKQCKLISGMLRDLQCPAYILAAEYETCVAMLEADARPNLRRVWKRRIDDGRSGNDVGSRVLLDTEVILNLIWRFFSEEKFYECRLNLEINDVSPLLIAARVIKIV